MKFFAKSGEFVVVIVLLYILELSLIGKVSNSVYKCYRVGVRISWFALVWIEVTESKFPIPDWVSVSFSWHIFQRFKKLHPSGRTFYCEELGFTFPLLRKQIVGLQISIACCHPLNSALGTFNLGLWKS